MGKGLGEGLKGFREGLKGITDPSPSEKATQQNANNAPPASTTPAETKQS
jgi:sec-independent protein translocase protein TatA